MITRETATPDETTGRFNAQYMGDGVYATTTGYSVCLDLRTQDVQALNTIHLERETLANINEYARTILGWGR